MRRQLISALILVVFLTAPAWGDDVYLKNGRTFEGVIAEVTETQVKIRLPFGEMTLAREDVLRVVDSDSILQVYLERKQRLLQDLDSEPGQWLELARWARRNDFEYGFREAALIAADLAPGLEGLEKAMRALDYVLDHELERWIPYRESMRRRGLRLHEGEWITREEWEQTTRRREFEALERRAAREPAQPDARDVALEALARVAVEQQSARAFSAATPMAYAAPMFVGWSAYVPPRLRPPVAAPPPPPADHPRLPVRTAPRYSSMQALVHRQPGSIIPLQPHAGYGYP